MPINKAQGKKDGLQKYRVRINYTDNLGVNRQIERTAYGLEAAKDLERQLNYEIKQEKPVRKLTVQALYDEYCEAQKHEVRETTLSKAMTNMRIHVLPLLGQVKIESLNMPILQKWKTDINEKELSARTKQNIFKVLNAVLNFALKME